MIQMTKTDDIYNHENMKMKLKNVIFVGMTNTKYSSTRLLHFQLVSYGSYVHIYKQY